ncbi:baseplate J/gp47 family protein [Afifella sp. IM 167]|uniref:baseplate J/gp47 family protein n=1 Tax=Afifella sp. IM 167 TaxID=2033586 RepID=UPI001CCBFFF2|nr:baseplate J/gp47 family protein [Afifella sp. IM 167]MBZ8133217.1 hypothetical protein [Afifella sp. IM 167]
MSYTVRSLAAISQSVRGAFRQYLPGTDATLKQNVLYVTAKVLALLAFEYEQRIAWIFRQLFLSTATSLAIVRLHAAEIGVTLKPASAASGAVTGTGTPSEVYPAGVRFLSAGIGYVTTASFQADALGAFVAGVKAEATGATTNREAGAVLALADPALWPTLPAEVVVASGGLGGGADSEDIESLRKRALDRKRRPPKGGALSDYEQAALAVSGVSAAWARQMTNGIGGVGVWVLFAGRANGIPTEADLAAVQGAIDAKRLIRAKAVAIAPVATPLDLTIALTPDSVAARAAVTAALKDFFDPTRPDSRIRPGLPEEPFLLTRAWLSEAISTTVGEENHTLVVPDGPTGFQSGELPVLGTIDWA